VDLQNCKECAKLEIAKYLMRYQCAVTIKSMFCSLLYGTSPKYLGRPTGKIIVVIMLLYYSK
jgi:hypothetical protein